MSVKPERERERERDQKGGALLIDVDSKIPNLALMHISTWRKNEGIPASFTMAEPSEIWQSVVFEKNSHKVDGLRWLYPNAMIDVGGTGIDVHKNLPGEVDLLMPDYSLYPDMDYDLGFTSRGCDRNCPFCFVPRKEGKFRIHQHPREFHDPTHRKVKLLDNNILFDKSWFFEVTDWIIENKLAVEFNQGLDIRLMDKEVQERLKQLKIWKTLHFAFDSMDYRDDVENGLAVLEKAGLKPRTFGFYVYTASDSMFDDALERCNILRSYGTTAYVMLDPRSKRTQRMQDLKRWSMPFLFFKYTYKEYHDLHRHLDGNSVNGSLDIFGGNRE